MALCKYCHSEMTACEGGRYLLFFQKFCRCDCGDGGTCEVSDISGKDAARTVPFRYSIHNCVLKVRHGAHECGMNICALYVCKGDKLGKLFDPYLCFWGGLERLAEYIENIRDGGCRNQTFRIGFNGSAESLVGICEKWLSFLDNIQNDIGINQYFHCLDSRSSRMVFSSIV